MKVTALAGGVGGAKLAQGFSKILKPNEFNVIVNTGDDFKHLGLSISPDIDTVVYALADHANPKTGWGRKDETYETINEIKKLNGPDWFLLGDKDLAFHLIRSQLLDQGFTLSEITRRLAFAMGVEHQIIPMTNGAVRTIVDTEEYGEISFQEYFVKNQFEPVVKGFRFEGIDKARPAEDAVEALLNSDLIVICPSNPYVSIAPIINFPEIRRILFNKLVIGVSPIIGDKAVKGPLGKLFHDFGKPVNAFSVAEMYQDFLNIFIIDRLDPEHDSPKLDSSIIIKRQAIFLPDISARVNLAEQIIKISKENI